MKKLLVLFLAVCMVSCSDDDPTEVVNSELSGEWILTNVVCFCIFPDPTDFERTTISFATNSNILTVSHGGPSIYFREAGSYSYTVDGNRITVEEDGRSYIFDIEENILSLQFVDQPNLADDEIVFTLMKN